MTKARTNADNASADIQGVTAGTGLSGGGTSGTVTLTNDMATTINAAGDLLYGTANDAYTRLGIGTARQALLTNPTATAPEWGESPQSVLTAKGDLLYASAANQIARLGVGTSGQYLTTDGLTPSWGTLSAGGMTLLSTTTLSGSTVSVTSINQNYVDLKVVIMAYSNNSGSDINIGFNSSTTLVHGIFTSQDGGAPNSWANQQSTGGNIRLNPSGGQPTAGNTQSFVVLELPRYSTSDSRKPFNTYSTFFNADQKRVTGSGYINTTSAISSIQFILSAGTFSAGTMYIYGVK